jgi:hypothetical protein
MARKFLKIRLANAGAFAGSHTWNLAFPVGRTAPRNGGIRVGGTGATSEQESAGDSSKSE